VSVIVAESLTEARAIGWQTSPLKLLDFYARQTANASRVLAIV